MSNNNAWRKAFPAVTATRVVEHLLQTWGELAARKVPAFSWKVREPKLTLTLKQILSDTSLDAGLTGHWGCEDQSVKLNPKTLKHVKGFRTDILYFSDLEKISLTFEWKKLRNTSTSRKAYNGAKGMGRFLEKDGYAKHEPFGLMVGIIESSSHRSDIQSLISSIKEKEVIKFLKIIPDAHGYHVRSPSNELPNQAEFDTQHKRVSAKHMTFTFGHLFVEF